MGFEFVTLETIDELIEKEVGLHETQVNLLMGFREFISNGDTLFHNLETDEWFLVPKGNPVPQHLVHLLKR